VFLIVPRFLRDAVYDWIGRRRYRMFGKRETCWVPRPELAERFLDSGTEPEPVRAPSPNQ
jgi:predicted DCC family thiol-disulfide oxidoreductase YuxK